MLVFGALFCQEDGKTKYHGEEITRKYTRRARLSSRDAAVERREIGTKRHARAGLETLVQRD